MRLNLFKNKKTKDTQPDYRGKVVDDMGETVIEGSGWIKKTKSGDDYISLQIKELKPKTEEELNAPLYEDGLPF